MGGRRQVREAAARREPVRHTARRGRPSILRRHRLSIASVSVAMLASLGIGMQSAVANDQVDGVLAVSPGKSRHVTIDGATGAASASARFTVAERPVGGGLYLAVHQRVTGAGQAYIGKARIMADASMRIGLARRVGGSDQSLGSTWIPGTFKPGSAIRVELRVAGNAPVRVQARAWLDGTPKPSWQYTVDDQVAPALATTGDAQVWAYSSQAGTTHRIVFDEFSVTPDATAPAPPPVPVPTDTPTTQPPAPTATKPPPTQPPAPTATMPPPTIQPPAPTTTQPPAPTTKPPTTQPPAPTTTTQPPAPTTKPPTTPPTTQPPAPSPTKPPTGGRPNADNTGVPAGTALKRHDGDLVVKTAGTRIDAMDVYGSIVVEAPNVTITRTRVHGGPASYPMGLINNTKGAANLVVEDSTLIPDKPHVYSYGLKGANFVARRVEVARTVDSAQIHGNNVRIESSWLHDHIQFASDPYQSGGATHNDGVQVLGGTNIAIAGNVITGATNAALQVTQDFAATKNLSFTNNWVDNGICSVKMNHKDTASSMGPVTIGDNRFGRGTSASGCAILKTAATSVNAWNNVWDDNGSTVPIKVHN